METHLLKPDSCAVQCNDMSSCHVGQCAGVWPSQTFVFWLNAEVVTLLQVLVTGYYN